MCDHAVSGFSEYMIRNSMTEYPARLIFIQPTFLSYLCERCLLTYWKRQGYIKSTDSMETDEIVLDGQLLSNSYQISIPDYRSAGIGNPLDQA